MGIDLSDFFHVYGSGTLKEPPLESLVRGNFIFHYLSRNQNWALIEHRPTREQRWVYSTHLRVKELAVAYYDADPTFLPLGEQ